jgi:hypothetical protein
MHDLQSAAFARRGTGGDVVAQMAWFHPPILGVILATLMSVPQEGQMAIARASSDMSAINKIGDKKMSKP